MKEFHSNYSDDEIVKMSVNWLEHGTPPPHDAGEVIGRSFKPGVTEEKKSAEPITVIEFPNNKPAIVTHVKTVEEALRVGKPVEKPVQAPKSRLVTAFTAFRG